MRSNEHGESRTVFLYWSSRELVICYKAVIKSHLFVPSVISLIAQAAVFAVTSFSSALVNHDFAVAKRRFFLIHPRLGSTPVRPWRTVR